MGECFGSYLPIIELVFYVRVQGLYEVMQRSVQEITTLNFRMFAELFCILLPVVLITFFGLRSLFLLLLLLLGLLSSAELFRFWQCAKRSIGSLSGLVDKIKDNQKSGSLLT